MIKQYITGSSVLSIVVVATVTRYGSLSLVAQI